MMVAVTNKLSEGARGLNVVVGKLPDGSLQLGSALVLPGETVDMDLHDPDHPVVQSWLATGDVTARTKAAKADSDDPPAKAAAKG